MVSERPSISIEGHVEAGEDVQGKSRSNMKVGGQVQLTELTHMSVPQDPARQSSPIARMDAYGLNNSSERKRGRLFAMFSLWQSKAEMHESSNVTENISLQVLSPARSRTGRAVCHHTMQHQVILLPSSNLPFAATAAPANLNEVISEKVLWQTLALSVVLGSLIVLITLVARQISLTRMSDTLVMVTISGMVFLLISCFAFYVAKDGEATDGPCEHQLYSGCPTGLNSSHAVHCQHAMGQTHRSRRSESNGRRSDKHCSLSIIDCSPPDYHSALRDSYPTSLSNTRGDNYPKYLVAELNDELCEPRSSPTSDLPSYDELAFLSQGPTNR